MTTETRKGSITPLELPEVILEETEDEEDHPEGKEEEETDGNGKGSKEGERS